MDAVSPNAFDAPAPFVGLRRAYNGAIVADPASRFKLHFDSIPKSEQPPR